MESIRKITTKLLLDFNQSIANDIHQKGIDDTGDAAKSLRVESDSNSAKSIGLKYIYFLDKGRKPGKFPPVDVMRAWVQSKPITMNIDGKELTVDQMAYLVGKGIAEKGTTIYRNRSKGIELDEKIKKLRQEIKQQLPASAKAEALNRLKDAKFK